MNRFSFRIQSKRKWHPTLGIPGNGRRRNIENFYFFTFFQETYRDITTKV